VSASQILIPCGRQQIEERGNKGYLKDLGRRIDNCEKEKEELEAEIERMHAQ
jgi:hypothetical protein